MQKYVSHLLSDIEDAIVRRWRKCPPHFWQHGLPDPYLAPPAGVSGPDGGRRGEEARREPEWDESELRESLREMENWLDSAPELSMFYHFDLEPEAFPPPDRLTDDQLERLVHSLRRLWAAFNFTAVVPAKAPARVVYPLLLRRMTRPTMVLDYGNIGVEFCDYDPAGCPFGREYCDCREHAEDGR